MKARGRRRDRFTGGKLIRSSLILAAVFLVAAAVLAGPFRAPSMAAETQKSQKPIKLGLFGVTSGSGGIAGEACRRGVEMWVDEVNGRGGLLGRKVEFVQRDTGGKPEEAVRWAREYCRRRGRRFSFRPRFERRGLCRRLGFEGDLKVNFCV